MTTYFLLFLLYTSDCCRYSFLRCNSSVVDEPSVFFLHGMRKNRIAQRSLFPKRSFR